MTLKLLALLHQTSFTDMEMILLTSNLRKAKSSLATLKEFKFLIQLHTKQKPMLILFMVLMSKERHSTIRKTVYGEVIST